MLLTGKSGCFVPEPGHVPWDGHLGRPGRAGSPSHAPSITPENFRDTRLGATRPRNCSVPNIGHIALCSGLGESDLSSQGGGLYMVELSRTFSIDPTADRVQRHNAEVREVLEAWRNDRPVRVPLLCDDTAIQHGLYAGETGVDYEKYYTDPDEMTRVQLEAARFRREQPIYDLELGVTPDSWPVTIDFWPVPSQGWIGCDITYRKDASPVHHPLDLSREECDAIEMPDPRNGGMLKKTREFMDHIDRHWVGKVFLGKPIGPVHSGVAHNGLLAMAMDVRGHDILTDFYEDPEFAHRFLIKMAEWCDALDRAWSDAFASCRPYFRNTDHGIDMLSPETYEEFILPVIVEMNRRRGTSLPTGWHYCGSGMHLVPVFKRHYPLERLDDVTYPMLDLAEVRKIVGNEVRIKAQIADGIVHTGPSERIRDAVRGLMQSGAKGSGRFALSVGDMLRGTPMAHRKAFYEAVKEFGG